jgi:sugar phosphate isomerase/epimerase
MHIFICHSSEYGPLEANIRICENNGFGIELSDFSHISKLDDITLIKNISEKIANITARAIHAPYLGIDPVSNDTAIRETSIHCYQKVYETAAFLKVRHIICHPAYDPDMFYPLAWIKETRRFWSAFLTDKDPEVHFHLENVMDSSPEMLRDLVAQVNQPNLNINLDIGHVNVYSKIELTEWISTLGKMIGYVHLHHNHAAEDEHIGLGRGNIPLPQVLDKLQKQSPKAIWAIEAGGAGTLQSIRWLGQHGYIKHEIRD